ncbi:MAG TPA: DinB family protein [Thermoanaerobaculia bacterium]|nr:DinB family protein [Thermoanaerobaculia bacterium]
MIDEVREQLDGKPWHGNSLLVTLEGIDDALAHAHPVPNGRSIAELLAHMSAWVSIVERRLRGEEVAITPELDFPAVDGRAWADLVQELETAYARLMATVGEIADWRVTVAGKRYTREYMLRGLLHHNTYHAAQIAMLKKFA